MIELNKKKIKVLTLGDHPLAPSGVGTQTRYVIEALLKTGNFEVISLGGAIKHQSYEPIRLERWAGDWTIYPVDDYGNHDIIRSVMRTHRPDIVWIMTDPRFWGWLWQIENEIRAVAPLVYYHVWDNYPYPSFNKRFYESNDVIASISKVTYDIVNNVTPSVANFYVPHSVDTEIFKKLDPEEVAKFRKENMPDDSGDGRMIFFWNNRNARRKQSGTLIYWFDAFLNKIGRDKACLIMHTDSKDPNGQDLAAIIRELGADHGEILLSQDKMPQEGLSMMYNMADCTINCSDAEGFGLATLESLACETPIIVTMTGGLQEQVTDGEDWFGIGMEPVSKSVIGSQSVPYIYEDRLNEKTFVDTLVEFYNMEESKRAQLGEAGRGHVLANYNFNDFENKWVELLTGVHDAGGSWKNRKNYNSWKLTEVLK